MASPVLELAVQDPTGVAIAVEVGAKRVELCSALGATGGLTPSGGLLAAAIVAAGTDIEVHPLVRPRPGDFVYRAVEIDVQLRDIAAAIAAGAAGVVVGALAADGTIDSGVVREFVAAAGGREVTFHRAIDTVPDRLTALETLAQCGVTRVLTSGGAPTCAAGLEPIGEMVRRGAEVGVQIMAGGGVRVGDISDLVSRGVAAVHLSAKSQVSASGGPGGGGDGGYEVTDLAVARAAAAALQGATARIN